MKGKKIFWGIIMVIAMLVIAGATCFIMLHFFSDNNSQDYTIKQTGSPSSLAENHSIDWHKLKEKNADVYAWIYVPGTKVDYVVVQPAKSKSDLFYMDRNLDKEYEFAGSIFTERHNKKDFSDPVTLMYGHNMLNGSMFATLHKFKDPKFFKKHKKMYVYQPNRKLTNSFDFTDAKVLKKYQKMTLNPKAMDKNVRKKTSLGPNSKILTLSTCTNGASNTRYLVQGVLISDEQTD